MSLFVADKWQLNKSNSFLMSSTAISFIYFSLVTLVEFFKISRIVKRSRFLKCSFSFIVKLIHDHFSQTNGYFQSFVVNKIIYSTRCKIRKYVRSNSQLHGSVKNKSRLRFYFLRKLVTDSTNKT